MILTTQKLEGWGKNFIILTSTVFYDRPRLTDRRAIAYSALSICHAVAR